MGGRTMSGFNVQPKGSHYIDGAFRDGGSETFNSHYAGTSEVIATLSVADEAVVDQAVKAAVAAQQAWVDTPAPERGRILIRTAEIVRRRNDEIARVETLDTGKALSETLYVDAASAADNLEYFGHLVSTLTSEHIPHNQTSYTYTLREPLGVVGAIGAWNYPIQIAAWKAAPSLALGNAIIFKPSEITPLSALLLAECFEEAGLPAGLFNVVQGLGATGAALVSHPQVDKVSLTGSVPTGAKVMAAAAADIKHVTLELGGKSPLVIFDDADLENAVSGALMANFYSSGQVCSNGTRVFVQSGIRDAFTKRLVERVEAITHGDPLDPNIQMGPMISAQQAEIVMGHIDKAKASGATLLTGGDRLVVEEMPDAHFIAPTVFSDVADHSGLARDEVFGPVLALFSFEDEADVIERANDTVFGLSAGVFTRDIARAHRVIARLKAGTTWINNYNVTPVGMPFGGHKRSGIGRENAAAAVDYYSQIKSVYVELGDVDAPY